MKNFFETDEGAKLNRALDRVTSNPRNNHDWLRDHAHGKFRKLAVGALFTRYDLISNDVLGRLQPSDNRVIGPIMLAYSRAGLAVKVGNFTDPRRSHRGTIQQWQKVRDL